MRVTIFGASGLLGRALMREWSGDEVVGLMSRDADIRDAGQVQSARGHFLAGAGFAGDQNSGAPVTD